METDAEQNIPEVDERGRLKRANMMGNMISESQELLPGIPNDVTLDHISTKLSWRAINILSSVSKAWQQEICSGLVYDTRVRHQSLETLVLHSHHTPSMDKEVLCLYSSRDERCYELPGIPGVNRGIPRCCKWISLDGKIYVLGGKAKDKDIAPTSEDVYVLNVALRKKWKKLSSMQSGRDYRLCGILDGKIFSLACADRRLDSVSQVHNPKTDTWYPVKELTLSMGCSFYRVDAHGVELFVHRGYVYPIVRYFYAYYVLDTRKSEWRMERLEWRLPRAPFRGIDVFMVEGKFYLMTSGAIMVLDDSSNDREWKHLHAFSYAGFRRFGGSWGERCYVTVVDDELITKMSIETSFDAPRSNPGVDSLVKSEGFRGEKDKFVWRRINCDNKLGRVGDFIHHIQL